MEYNSTVHDLCVRGNLTVRGNYIINNTVQQNTQGYFYAKGIVIFKTIQPSTIGVKFRSGKKNTAPHIITKTTCFRKNELIMFNNFICEVLSHASGKLIIRGIGSESNIEDFTANQIDNSDNESVISKVFVSIYKDVFAQGSSVPLSYCRLATIENAVQKNHLKGNRLLKYDKDSGNFVESSVLEQDNILLETSLLKSSDEYIFDRDFKLYLNCNITFLSSKPARQPLRVFLQDGKKGYIKKIIVKDAQSEIKIVGKLDTITFNKSGQSAELIWNDYWYITNIV